jgi:hypothetical protein
LKDTPALSKEKEEYLNTLLSKNIKMWKGHCKMTFFIACVWKCRILGIQCLLGG